MAQGKSSRRSGARDQNAGPVQESLQKTSQTLVRHAVDVAETCGAAAIFIHADALEAVALPRNLNPKVIFIVKTEGQQQQMQDEGADCLRVPNVHLTRMGQVKIAVFLAQARGMIKPGQTIVCLTGMAASGTLDTLVVVQVGREFEMYRTENEAEQIPSHIRPEVVERVVDIATELGNEGREGKPVGALFVVGDAERVIELSRQLILNPFRGYSPKERNLLDPALEETVKELAGLDGAFVVQGDGVIETCGSFLTTVTQDESALPHGLGARHHAAAAITILTDSIAVTVSESTGTVTIFRSGKIVTDIEKPRSVAQQREFGGSGSTHSPRKEA